jgi:hypothetical protein
MLYMVIERYLMETDDPALFEVWTRRWHDLVEFEVFPVVTSAEAAVRLASPAGPMIGVPPTRRRRRA